jgi:hypothetical protein
MFNVCLCTYGIYLSTQRCSELRFGGMLGLFVGDKLHEVALAGAPHALLAPARQDLLELLDSQLGHVCVCVCGAFMIECVPSTQSSTHAHHATIENSIPHSTHNTHTHTHGADVDLFLKRKLANGVVFCLELLADLLRRHVHGQRLGNLCWGKRTNVLMIGEDVDTYSHTHVQTYSRTCTCTHLPEHSAGAVLVASDVVAHARLLAPLRVLAAPRLDLPQHVSLLLDLVLLHMHLKVANHLQAYLAVALAETSAHHRGRQDVERHAHEQ